MIHDRLDLDVHRGEILGIVGGSGSGKSVLLRTMLMLLAPGAGTVRLLGHATDAVDKTLGLELRRRIGVLFQQGALFSSLSVLENVAFPLREHVSLSKRLVAELAMLKLALAGLPPDAAGKRPRELSGGMLKRAALARALALDPELLFLDEPTAGLDPVSAGAFDTLISALRRDLKLTVVMVTHDLDSLWGITDRVAFLGEKRVLAVDALDPLSTNPHPLIAGYFSGPRARAAKAEAWKAG